MTAFNSAAGKLYPREPDWKVYLGQIAAGNPESLTKLYDESCRLVYSLIFRMLGNAADAEEVSLDVYLQVWRTARSFDVNRGSATTWLMMIARSRALDRLRAAAAASRVEVSGEASEAKALQQRCLAELPDQRIVLNQRSASVLAALRKLEPNEREVIELAYFVGMSHSEIAAKLNKPLGTIKTHIRQAVSALRRDFPVDQTAFTTPNGKRWRTEE